MTQVRFHPPILRKSKDLQASYQGMAHRSGNVLVKNAAVGVIIYGWAFIAGAGAEVARQ